MTAGFLFWVVEGADPYGIDTRLIETPKTTAILTDSGGCLLVKSFF